MLPADIKQHTSLIATIGRTQLKGKAALKAVLSCVFTRQSQGLTPIRWQDISKALEIGDVQRGGNTTRERCSALREELKAFSDGLEYGETQCVLTKGGSDEGYLLQFPTKVAAPTSMFWNEHVTCRANIVVVHNKPPFFHDVANNTVFRIWDLEDQVSTDKNLRRLIDHYVAVHRQEHAQCDVHNCSEVTGIEHRVKRLRIRRLYTFADEAEAVTRLRDWFESASRITLRTQVSHMADQPIKLEGESQILLGSRRTNPLIRYVFDGPDSQYLAYKCHGSKFGSTIVTNPTDAETSRIASCEFIEDGDYRFADDTYLFHPEIDSRNAFCVITRIQNPYDGRGLPMTIFSSDYVRAIERTVRAVTDDELFLTLAEADGFPVASPVPIYFQALVVVRLSEDERKPAGKANIVCWRAYPRRAGRRST